MVGFRAIQTELETAALRLIYGERLIEEIRDELIAAEDHAELQQQVYESRVANWIANVDKLQELQKRRAQEIVDVLRRKRGERFVRARVRSVHGDEFDGTAAKPFGGK